jgi:exodeoxyribonuclease-3
MSNLKIATWNVNSLRIRLPHVIKWLNEARPDILALQEIKCQELNFPYDAISALGYQAIVSGQKSYNGVSIFFKASHGLSEIMTDIPGFDDQSRRILGATINNNIRILNLYVPNGEHITSLKYQYKLNWLQKLDIFLKDELKKYPNLIVLGDFNIAPEAIDIHDPALFEGQVLFSQLERQAYRNLLQGLNDCYRHIHPTEKNFTWWDYRLNAFKRNMGVRIDHILASSPFVLNCMKCEIDRIPRAWERPSDHTPVIAEFKIH